MDCFKYNFALVSRIASSFAENSSFDVRVGQKVNIERARKEHEDLVETLRRIGLDVIELPSDEKHPDGLFVDDVAIVIHGTALMCNPPTFKDRPSRQGEVPLQTFLCHNNSLWLHVQNPTYKASHSTSESHYSIHERMSRLHSLCRRAIRS